MPKILEGKKIAMLIAFKDFRDAEYFTPKKILEQAGAEVKTASNKMGLALGAEGGDARIDFLVKDLRAAEFDAIIFVGGPDCLSSLDNDNSYRVAKEIVSQNKVLAAICVSPVILAKAGVLAGKRATVWSSTMDKSAIKTLQENGAIFLPFPVVRDGKIITANGPASAKEFGEKIREVLTVN